MADRRRTPALVDEAYIALGEAIVDGRLQPGDRLRDVELAELMGISRTPVREALQKLERIGLVEVAANRYTRVAPLSDRQRHDMREYAAHTIAGAVRIGVRRCTDDELAAAVDLIERMRTAGASREYVSGVLRFYAHMVAASRNITFSKALEQTDLVLRRNLDGWEPIADSTRETLFRHLHDQVAARDANGATWTFLALHGFA